jgi:hypothetical protein
MSELKVIKAFQSNFFYEFNETYTWDTRIRFCPKDKRNLNYYSVAYAQAPFVIPIRDFRSITQAKGT